METNEFMTVIHKGGKMDQDDCPHPPLKLMAWMVPDPVDQKKRITCVVCCQCNLILKGAAD